MRSWIQSFDFKALLMGLVVFVLVILQVLFATDPWPVHVFSPVPGVVLALVMVYGRRVYVPVLFAAFFGGLVHHPLVLATLAPPYAFLVSVASVCVLFIQIESGFRILTKHAFRVRMEKAPLVAYAILLLVGVLVGLVGSLAAVGLLLAMDAPMVTEGLFLAYWYVHSLAFLIFMPLLYLALMEHPRKEQGEHGRLDWAHLIFFGVFSGLLLTFSFLPEGHFLQQQFYLYILFFLGGGFFLTYRALLAMVAMFLLVVRIFYIHLEGSGFIEAMINLASFTIVALVLTLLLKRFKDLRNEKNRSLLGTTRDLDNMLAYVRGFFNLSKGLFSQRHNFDAFARETFEIAGKLFSPDATFGYYENEGAIEVKFARGHPVKRIPHLYDLHDANEIRDKQVVIFPDVHLTLKKRYGEAFADFDSGKKTYMRVLLVFHFRPKLFFIVGLDYDEETPYKDIDVIKMKEFAALLNKLFTKNYLDTQTIELKEDIILTLVRVLELYDRHTKGHSEDVAAIAVRLGQRMALDEETIRDLYYAGLLHDIGKLGVDAETLNKPATLTAEEYDSIKEHVRLSHESLRGVEELATIRRMVWDHHERYDGKGYPEGLKGEDISLGGRILAIADALSTMAADRPYRKRLAKEAIVAELQAHRGSQFCPGITDLTIELIAAGAFDDIFA